MMEFIPSMTTQKYCSTSCYKKAKAKRNRRKRSSRYNVVCIQCGSDFQSEFMETKYCSLLCIVNGTVRGKPSKKKKFLDIPSCLESASRKLDKTLGYVRVYVPMHPEANTWGYAYEHRIIAEQMIGRRLEKDEIVHHKNGKRWDNRPENLEVMNKKDHGKLHGQREEDLDI